MEALAQLRDWMLGEFRLMLIEWDLGVTIDAIYPIARSLLIERFRQPPLATQEQLWQWFDQAQAMQNDASEATTAEANPARLAVRRVMVQALTQQDWQALRQAAMTALDRSFDLKLSQVHPPS